MRRRTRSFGTDRRAAPVAARGITRGGRAPSGKRAWTGRLALRHLQVGHDDAVTRRSRADNDLMVTMVPCQPAETGQNVCSENGRADPFDSAGANGPVNRADHSSGPCCEVCPLPEVGPTEHLPFIRRSYEWRLGCVCRIAAVFGILTRFSAGTRALSNGWTWRTDGDGVGNAGTIAARERCAGSSGGLIGRCSMASSGNCAPVPRGAICRSAPGRGAPTPCGSPAGSGMGPGTACWPTSSPRRMRWGR